MKVIQIPTQLRCDHRRERYQSSGFARVALLVVDDHPARVEVYDIEAFRGVGHRAVAGRRQQHPQRIQTISVVRFSKMARRGSLDALFEASDKAPQDIGLGQELASCKLLRRARGIQGLLTATK